MGLKRDLENFKKDCADSGVKVDRAVDRDANAPIAKPPGC